MLGITAERCVSALGVPHTTTPPTFTTTTTCVHTFKGLVLPRCHYGTIGKQKTPFHTHRHRRTPLHPFVATASAQVLYTSAVCRNAEMRLIKLRNICEAVAFVCHVVGSDSDTILHLRSTSKCASACARHGSPYATIL